MKKNFFRSLSVLAALVSLVSFSSCAGEELLSEDFSADRAEAFITLEAPVETEVVKTEGTGSVRRWELSDGQTVTARHSGNLDVNSIEIVEIDEVPSGDNTTTVNVTVRSKSNANTITRSVSYAKMVKAAPEPVNPTITREYFVADTAMTYKAYNNASKMFKVSMNHRLAKVTEWSDGRKDSVEVWNKDFLVAKTYFAPTNGRLYSETAAANLAYKANISILNKEESKEDAFTISKNDGEFVFFANYVCDAKTEQTYDAHVALEVSNVAVSYEDYSASYNFEFSVDFLGQKEENRGVENESRSGHTYSYESTSVGSWSIALNGVKLGVITNDIEVFHF